MQRLGLVCEPLWLQQVHGREVVMCGQTGPAPRADAVTAAAPGKICAVLTADCLPVLLCHRSGKQVAAVHAGWRGLLAGVIESAVASFGDSPDRILAWLGPAIGPEAFEVGSEVRDAFVQSHPQDEQAFSPGRGSRWMADLYRLAANRLARCGVSFVWGGEYCTHSDPKRFFSYRRDGRTGRMASLIWIDDQQ
jgi:YfiH family protein